MLDITSGEGTCICTVMDMSFDIERIIRDEIRDLPVYSPGKSPEEVARELGLEGCVKMASNENPLGPSPLAVRAVGEQLPFINLYPDGNSVELKEALSERLEVPRENLLITHGADEAFDLMAYAFLGPGDNVVVGEPTFSSYELAARTMGAEVIRVPLLVYRQDIPSMLEAVGYNTKMVMLCSPLNPTGTTVQATELEEMLEWLPDGVLLVLDEAYLEYVTDHEHPDALKYCEGYPGLLIVRTFSKIYGLAGLRVGYTISSPQVCMALEKVKLPFNVNRLGQAAALAALEDEDHLDRSREVNARGKKRLYALLEKLGFEYVPSQANFILVLNGPYPDLSDRLLRQGVIVRAGEALGLPGHVRITIGDDEQNDALERALMRIAGEG
ncbi:MAG: histidinol-phosphate transaminase [Actinomycetota bacterium]